MKFTKPISKLSMAIAIPMIAIPLQQGVAATGESTACLQLRRIDHTHVVDDQNILFYLRGDNIYLNHLENPAIGLDVNEPFMYETSVGRICENDFITVLERSVFGLRRGASSTLGRFEPVDDATAQSLRSGETAPVETEAVEPQ